MKFEIVCDSSADLPESDTKEAKIHVVPYYVSLDGEKYQKEGVDIAVTDFYQAMINHADCFPKTSMPTIPDYISTFLPFAQNGIPVLCICLTEKFSGSLQSARNAALAVKDRCPDAEIYVMDSRLVTALEGLFVKEAVRLRNAGLSLAEAVPLLEDIRNTGRIFFTTKDLKYLEHGGRLGKVASLAGSVLNLKPVLNFHDGDLDTTEICRGRKKSIERIADNFFCYLEKEKMDLHGYLFGTGIGADVPEYPAFIETLEKRFSASGIQPECWLKVRIGATIGVHTGPYPMGLGILKKAVF